MDNINQEMQFLIYRSDEDDVAVNAVIRDEDIWVTQKGMAELFGCSTDNISLHLKNIYGENELDKSSTAEEFSVVRLEGKREVSRSVTHYNLDAIISVGYRVNSRKATKFRIWAKLLFFKKLWVPFWSRNSSIAYLKSVSIFLFKVLDKPSEIGYNNNNRTRHASQRCGPRRVI